MAPADRVSGATWQVVDVAPVFEAEFLRSRIDDPISTFAAADASLEAAFPDRFIRNAAGALVALDEQPVNYAWALGDPDRQFLQDRLAGTRLVVATAPRG